jgi:hypothetical protein
MATSRRDFLKKGTLVALAAGVPLSIITNVTGKEASVSLGRGSGLTKAGFSSQLNTQFRINNGNSQVLVKLIDVTDLAHRRINRPDKEGFSLIFRGSRANGLTQGTYQIEHEKLGTFSFLLVPISPQDKSAISYEAVVNRLYP